MTHLAPADCMHAAMVIDGPDRLCRSCGLRIPVLSAAEAIAAGRAHLQADPKEKP